MSELDDDDLGLQPVFRRPTSKRRVIPLHVIKKIARNEFLQGVPGFSCPACRVSYSFKFGAIAVKGTFGERTYYCKECIKANADIHKIG